MMTGTRRKHRWLANDDSFDAGRSFVVKCYKTTKKVDKMTHKDDKNDDKTMPRPNEKSRNESGDKVDKMKSSF